MGTAEADAQVYPAFKIATVVDALRAEGLPAEDVLHPLGLMQEDTVSPATRVSLNQVLKACAAADRMSADPHFAYRAGLRLHVSSYGMYGFAILSSMDFRKTIEFAIAYHELATPLVEYDFREEAGVATWAFVPVAQTRKDKRAAKFIIEMQFGILLSLFRDVMGPSFAVRALQFAFDPPDDAATYPELFGCPVQFGQSTNALVFESAWLDRRPEFGNQITYRSVRGLCEAMVEEFKLRAGVAGQLRRRLMHNLMRPMSIDRAAEAMRMSSRTLRRKLGEEKTSFRRIVADLRRDAALRYLSDTALTVEDIAELLGFSDAANFRHAFRRWTHAQPSAYRRDRRAQ